MLPYKQFDRYVTVLPNLTLGIANYSEQEFELFEFVRGKQWFIIFLCRRETHARASVMLLTNIWRPFYLMWSVFCSKIFDVQQLISKFNNSLIKHITTYIIH